MDWQNVNVGGMLCVRVLSVEGIPGRIKSPYVRVTLQPHQKVARSAPATINDGHGLPLEWRAQEPLVLELVGNCTSDDKFTDIAAAEEAHAEVICLVFLSLEGNHSSFGGVG